MKIYTRRGDKGTTSLYSGEVVDKDATRVECYGTVDEVGAAIGLLRVELAADHPWQEGLHRIQTELMDAMAHLATSENARRPPSVPLPVEGVSWAEAWIDRIEAGLGKSFEGFLLPGGTKVSALCHLVRTQMRRAERRLVSLSREVPVDPVIHAYFNRISDLFFALAREAIYGPGSGLSEEETARYAYRPRKG